METMNDYLDQIDAATQKLERGDLVEGKVLQVANDYLIVDIGHHKDGVIQDHELEEMTSDYQEGDQINLVVLGFKEDGQVLLSEVKAMKEFGTKILEDAEANDSMFEGKIKSIAKGGYRVSVSGIEGYLPFSLYQKAYLEDTEAHLGEKTMLKIERHDNRGYVFTRLPYDQQLLAKKSAEFNEKFSVGDTVKGKLIGFNKGGVVVDIDGMRGFIPRSEVSYSRNVKAEDMLNKDDVLELLIREIDNKKQNIVLSLKDTLKDPWESIGSELEIGDVFELKPNGENNKLYFYELLDGIRASIFKDKLPAELQKMDVEHKVVVANINYDKHRVDLDYADEDVFEYQNDKEESGNTLGALFGDQLKSLNLK